MVCAKNSLKIFCNNSSLRGVGKLYKTKSRFLRIIWFIFVLAMLLLFFYGVVSLFLEFFAYNTQLQTQLKLHDSTEFPSISLCHHQPFSERAPQLWKAGKVKSPRQFSVDVRNLMHHSIIEDNSWDLARDLLFADNMKTYYQSLDESDANDIGLQEQDILKYCTIREGNKTLLGQHSENCALQLTKFESSENFNCFTISVRNSTVSQYVHEIDLIIFVGNETKSSYENGLLNNLFMQSRGIHLKLHERGTYPDMERDSIDIGPALSTKIYYDTHEWREADVKTEKCLQNRKHALFDAKSNLKYDYTFEACLSAETGRVILRNCSCVSPDFISAVLPNSSHPFCNKLDLNNPHHLFSRIQCLQHLDNTKLTTVIQERCPKPCHHFKYPTKVSSTSWSPAPWQLYWLNSISHAFEIVLGKINYTEDELIAAKYMIKNYTQLSDITNLPKGSNISSYYINEHNIHHYTFMRVVRPVFETIYREEKLTVTFNALVSRFGGIGSLTMGITAAFAAEFIEWIYLVYNQNKEIKKERIRTATEENENGKELSSMI